MSIRAFIIYFTRLFFFVCLFQVLLLLFECSVVGGFRPLCQGFHKQSHVLLCALMKLKFGIENFLVLDGNT